MLDHCGDGINKAYNIVRIDTALRIMSIRPKRKNILVAEVPPPISHMPFRKDATASSIRVCGKCSSIISSMRCWVLKL